MAYDLPLTKDVCDSNRARDNWKGKVRLPKTKPSNPSQMTNGALNSVLSYPNTVCLEEII